MAEEDECHATTDELAALIRSVPLYPTLETLCASQGFSADTVENWLRRGRQPGAPDILAKFTELFLKAEARHAADLYRDFHSMVLQGDSRGAKVLLDMIDRRWKLGASSDALMAVKRGKKRTDDLKAMLSNPSPRLRAALRETGWQRLPDWQPVVRQLPAAPEENDSTTEH